MKTIAESEIVLTESEKEKELSSMWSEALGLSTVAENEELNENETD
jgi:hypothetical protein